MPAFSQESVSKLSTCHPDIQVLFYEVIKYFDCMILEGHRDQAQQDADFAAGRSKLQWPNGKHNATPSNAVDVMACPVDYTNSHRLYYFAGIVMGIAERLLAEGKIRYRIRWGGNWAVDNLATTQTFNDLAHYEIII